MRHDAAAPDIVGYSERARGVVERPHCLRGRKTNAGKTTQARPNAGWTVSERRIVPIGNTPRDYAWGQVGGISRALGWPDSDRHEAELWLGAHPLSPSHCRGDAPPWPDLQAREVAGLPRLPYLMKLLAAQTPLSLQAHPSAGQAAAGFAREEAAGLPLSHPTRNYKDPYAKPELIVAVHDGFEALCGFRPRSETLALIDDLAAIDPAPCLRTWARQVETGEDLRAAVRWLLSGDAEVTDLLEVICAVAHAEPERFELIGRLAREFPGDPGIAVAQMANHVQLDAREALWLPAGNIHAYLSGLGVELMGPSDNVLRGGLTPKHVDGEELQTVLDFEPGLPPWLYPERLADHVMRYRPSSLASGQDVAFELLRITGNATVSTHNATALVLEGGFDVATGQSSAHLAYGEAAFIEGDGEVHLGGQGLVFIASGL